MKNAEKIANIAKQMIGVCNVIINLAETEENETYDEIFWDELAHTQKLVLEFTKYAFEEPSNDEPVENTDEEETEGMKMLKALSSEEHTDDAFFQGELNSNIGDKTDDEVIIIEEEKEEAE